MSNWDTPDGDTDPDRDLKEADILLEKADALLRKHKVGDKAEQGGGTLGDLPLLTDVVDHGDDVPVAVPAGGRTVELAETLIDLDTALTREIESWFANELPQLIARELDKLPGRLQEEALAHMRATLIPTLSDQLSSRLGRARVGKR